MQEMNERDEQRVRRRPNEGVPTVFRSPVPMLRGIEKQKRVMFRRAPVDLFGVNDPEFNKDKKN
jgi:hypothetical protein